VGRYLWYTGSDGSLLGKAALETAPIPDSLSPCRQLTEFSRQVSVPVKSTLCLCR
jgi:hypothetical protein